jgi:hypothetical protein
MNGLPFAAFVVALISTALLGWWARGTWMKSRLWISERGDHFLLYFGRRIIGRFRTSDGAEARRKIIITEIEGRRHG